MFRREFGGFCPGFSAALGCLSGSRPRPRPAAMEDPDTDKLPPPPDDAPPRDPDPTDVFLFY